LQEQALEFKDYYAALGLAKDASADDIKRAYRKLARKYHPDVSKESDAEARFKQIGEAYEVLKDPEKRAAYDSAGQRWRERGAAGEPPPDWNTGYEFQGADFDDAGMDHSDFFEALFGRRARAAAQAQRARAARGEDHHAKMAINLEDAYHGATRTLTLRMPALDAAGHVHWQERQLEVKIPKGVRAGQHLRLAGQGSPGHGNAPAGDLFLELEFEPHPLYTVDGRDVSLTLPVAPWEAALGASVRVPTPAGELDLTVPRGSTPGRKLRVRGKGIPAATPGDLYFVLQIVAPPANTPELEQAYRTLAERAGAFDPRANLGVAR
jgi:curved DNA-binding protein